jgi:hypothetical protein
VAAAGPHGEFDPVLAQHLLPRIAQGILGREALGPGRVGRHAVDDRQVGVELSQGPLHLGAQQVEAQGVVFTDQHAPEAVHDQARQVVALGVAHAIGVGDVGKPQELAAQVVGGLEAPQQELARLIQVRAPAPREHAQADVRGGVVQTVAQEAARAIEHLDQGAVQGPRQEVAHLAGKDPGPPCNFLVGIELNRAHVGGSLSRSTAPMAQSLRRGFEFTLLGIFLGAPVLDRPASVPARIRAALLARVTPALLARIAPALLARVAPALLARVAPALLARVKGRGPIPPALPAPAGSTRGSLLAAVSAPAAKSSAVGARPPMAATSAATAAASSPAGVRASVRAQGAAAIVAFGRAHGGEEDTGSRGSRGNRAAAVCGSWAPMRSCRRC